MKKLEKQVNDFEFISSLVNYIFLNFFIDFSSFKEPFNIYQMYGPVQNGAGQALFFGGNIWLARTFFNMLSL